MVDIAVILLGVGSEFNHFILSLFTYARSTTVDIIEEFFPSSALFQAQYYNFDGCSGAGVVTTTVNNIVKVVGVHVASHEGTTAKAGKRKRKFVNFEASDQSVIHGHNA
eukprot:gene35079-47134_t